MQAHKLVMGHSAMAHIARDVDNRSPRPASHVVWLRQLTGPPKSYRD